MTEPLPLDRSQPLRGRDLRHAALAVLDQGGSASIGQILDALDAGGFRVAGEHPNKALADGLRHEVKRARLRRVGWGRYAIARLAKTTARRIRLRWHLAVNGRDVADVELATSHGEPAGAAATELQLAAARNCQAVMARRPRWRQWGPPPELPRPRSGRPLGRGRSAQALLGHR